MKLWGSQVVSKLADNCITFALVILIFQLSGSNFLVGLLVAIVAIPPILLSTGAGVIADSFDRRKILVIVNLLRAVNIAIALVFHNSVPVLMITAVTASIISQFFTPSESATIPTLVEKNKLFLANSFFSMTNYGAFLIGFSAAGPILERWGSTAPFIIGIVAYLLAAVLDSFLPRLNEHLERLTHRTINVLKDFSLVINRLKEGIRFVRTDRLILFIIFQVAVVFSIERAFISLVPSFSQDYLKFSVSEISTILILPTGLGTFVGALIANKFKHRVPKNKFINFGMFLDGILLGLFIFFQLFSSFLTSLIPGVDPLTFTKIYIFTLAFFSGFADPFIIVPAQTSLQEKTPNENRGRVFGVLTFTMNIFGIVAVLIIGGLADLLSLPVAVASLSIIILVVATWGVRFYRRHSLGVE